MSLLTGFSNGLIVVVSVCFAMYGFGYIVWRCIFQCKGYKMKNVIYKDDNLILQRLKEGRSRTLVVLGNGWNVSLDDNDRITKHDPIFQIPKGNLKFLYGCMKSYEVITAYFPFECEGIDQSAGMLADFLNHNYCDYRIILLGHSKSGAQFAQALNYLERNVKDVKLILVSPALGGVKTNGEIQATLGIIDLIIYRTIFVHHKVNDDITKGSYFLTKVADFSEISKYEAYLVRSSVAHKTCDLINNYLLHLDKKLSINGDGIIGYDEQYYDTNWTQKFSIIASHNNSMACAIRKMKDLSILWFKIEPTFFSNSSIKIGAITIFYKKIFKFPW